jgi:hypothetical protein
MLVVITWTIFWYVVINFYIIFFFIMNICFIAFCLFLCRIFPASRFSLFENPKQHSDAGADVFKRTAATGPVFWRGRANVADLLSLLGRFLGIFGCRTSSWSVPSYQGTTFSSETTFGTIEDGNEDETGSQRKTTRLPNPHRRDSQRYASG